MSPDPELRAFFEREPDLPDGGFTSLVERRLAVELRRSRVRAVALRLVLSAGLAAGATALLPLLRGLAASLPPTGSAGGTLAVMAAAAVVASAAARHAVD
jgi:hypothetical protein